MKPKIMGKKKKKKDHAHKKEKREHDIDISLSHGGRAQNWKEIYSELDTPTLQFSNSHLSFRMLVTCLGS